MDYSLYNSTLENCRAATTCYLQSEGPQCEIVCSASAAAQVRPKPSPVPNRVHQKQVGRDTLYLSFVFKDSDQLIKDCKNCKRDARQKKNAHKTFGFAHFLALKPLNFEA